MKSFIYIIFIFFIRNIFKRINSVIHICSFSSLFWTWLLRAEDFRALSIPRGHDRLKLICSSPVRGHRSTRAPSEIVNSRFTQSRFVMVPRTSATHTPWDRYYPNNGRGLFITSQIDSAALWFRSACIFEQSIITPSPYIYIKSKFNKNIL